MRDLPCAIHLQYILYYLTQPLLVALHMPLHDAVTLMARLDQEGFRSYFLSRIYYQFEHVQLGGIGQEKILSNVEKNIYGSQYIPKNTFHDD